MPGWQLGRTSGFSPGESEALLGNHQNHWFCKLFRSQEVTEGTRDQCARRTARSPPRTQGVILDPQGQLFLRGTCGGGRIEDACGEVTGHPFDEPYALIRGGLLVVGWSLVQG